MGTIKSKNTCNLKIREMLRGASRWSKWMRRRRRCQIAPISLQGINFALVPNNIVTDVCSRVFLQHRTKPELQRLMHRIELSLLLQHGMNHEPSFMHACGQPQIDFGLSERVTSNNKYCEKPGLQSLPTLSIALHWSKVCSGARASSMVDVRHFACTEVRRGRESSSRANYGWIGSTPNFSAV